MKNQMRKILNKTDESKLTISISQRYKDACTNTEILNIFDKIENAKTVEEQVTIIHSLFSNLNDSLDENTFFIVNFLTNLFVITHSKNPIKKSILRLFANSTSLRSLISIELAREFTKVIDSITYDDYHCFNDYINSINDCFNNCTVGILALSLITQKVFEFLLKCIIKYLEILNDCLSPTQIQELFNYLHNAIRSLVAVLQQCNNLIWTSEYVDSICKCCVEIFKNPDIFYDTKSNCGIILIIAVNSTLENSYTIFLQDSFNGTSKWKINFEDFNDDIAIICLYAGILNVVQPEQISTKHLFQILDKLLDISQKSADKPSIILAVNRVLLLVSRALNPLNENDFLQILTKLLDHVWIQLDHSVDTIRHVSKSILVNLVKAASIQQENEKYLAIDLIVKIVLETPIHKNGRYVALSIIANEIGCEILIQKEPKLYSKILRFTQVSSFSSYAISCYGNLIRCNLKEVNEETWLKRWVYPLTVELGNDKDLDPKGNCLQSLLIVAIKLRPSILNSILKQWTIDNELQFSSLLKCALIARKIGVVIKDENKWRGILDYSIFELGKCHQNDEIRISTLSLIAESHKTTELFNEFELKYVIDFLFYNINPQLPSTRQKILFLIKKILTRFSESYYGIIRNQSKIEENNTHNESGSIQKQKTIYENFIFELRNCIFDSLFPGANFSRRIICLEVLIFLQPIIKEILKNLHTPFDKLWKQTEVDSLLLCLHDSYESNKQLAIKLLEKCPVHYLKLDKIENTNEFIDNALSNAVSIKPADTITSAYMFECVMFSPIIKDVLLENVPGETSNYSEQYLIIKLLLNNLKDQVEIGKTSLLNAAASSPMYGTLFCIRHILEKFLFNNQKNETYWQQLVDEIIKTCFEVSDIVCSVVNNSSPEGHLPMDNETSDDATNEEDVVVVTSQMLLVCAWRSVKEVSLLLGELTLQSPIENENQNWLITEEQILKIGEHFTVLLTETKHRGAFEQAYVGFSKLCTRLWMCKSEILHHLPVTWLDDIMNAISGEKSISNNKLCATRRSAGVPFMIQAIMASELQNNINSNFHRCMTTLLKLANHPGDNIETRTHAMNILRALYRHTQLGEEILPYVADGLIVSITCFSMKSWAERNSATLLFSSLMTRTFGVQRTRDTEQLNIRNKMTAKMFFLRYPKLYLFLLEKLEELTHSTCEPYKEAALYPVLLLLARLYPTNIQEHETIYQLENFVPFVRACANNRNLKTRELAAVALVPLIPVQQRLDFLKELFLFLDKTKYSNNFIHGTLLQIHHLLRTITNLSNSINIAKMINIDTLDIIKCDSVNSCAVNAALYMQIIIKIIANCDLANDVTQKIISLLNKQDDSIERHRVVGKTLYYKLKMVLQIMLLIQDSHENKFENVCEFLFKSMNHNNEEVKEFVLNFLLYLFKNADTESLINDLELPDQEIYLVNMISEENKIGLIRVLNNQERNLLEFYKFMNNNNLLSKFIFVISNFSNGIFEIINKFYIYLINEDNANIASAVLLCISVILEENIKKNLNLFNLKTLFGIFLELSTRNHSFSCRYCIALILTKNSFLFDTNTSMETGNRILLWRTVMQLLADNELIIRNRISKLSGNNILAEKSREILLEKCVNQIKTISEELCISLLIFWSLTDFEPYINDDVEQQIFEQGEISTYVEDMCLHKISVGMLSKLICCRDNFDIHDVITKIVNIIRNDNELWNSYKNEQEILITVLSEIDKEESFNLKYFDKSNTWWSLNIFYKYKMFNIIKKLLPHENWNDK